MSGLRTLLLGRWLPRLGFLTRRSRISEQRQLQRQFHTGDRFVKAYLRYKVACEKFWTTTISRALTSSKLLIQGSKFPVSFLGNPDLLGTTKQVLNSSAPADKTKRNKKSTNPASSKLCITTKKKQNVRKRRQIRFSWNKRSLKQRSLASKYPRKKLALRRRRRRRNKYRGRRIRFRTPISWRKMQFFVAERKKKLFKTTNNDTQENEETFSLPVDMEESINEGAEKTYVDLETS